MADTDAAQIGEVRSGFNAVVADVNTVRASLGTHTADTANPHAVTTKQVNEIAVQTHAAVLSTYPEGLSSFAVQDTDDFAINAPGANWGTVLTQRVGAFRGTQLWMTTSTEVFMRSWSGGAWTGWSEVASQSSLDAHAASTANPHAVTKAQVGLASVDDVSAASLRDRATHTGTQAQSTITNLTTDLAGKADSGHNHDGTYAPAAHTSDTANPHAVTKEQVGIYVIENGAANPGGAGAGDVIIEKQV